MPATSTARALLRETQGDLFPDGGSARPESFQLEGKRIWRIVECRDGFRARSAAELSNALPTDDLAAQFDLAWLRSTETPPPSPHRRTVRIADLFAGCGAMSAGIREACRALQFDMQSVLAIECDPAKLQTYSINFPEAIALENPIEQIVDGELGAALTQSERDLQSKVGKLDILVGGPPCQGHSDLNNFTRRSDPRNQLILRFARSVEVLRPTSLIVENVQGIRHDKGNALSFVEKHLNELGYQVEQTLIDCAALGVPQRRRRFFLVASKDKTLELSAVTEKYRVAERTVRWACSDLLNKENPVHVFDSAAVHSSANQRRIEYLFDNDLFDLPNEMRPDCHRLKNHAYKAVYGRMRWDEPAPTITTGFGSTGQGRFVHPLMRRSLTPHEAARLQTIPDFFRFGNPGRTQLQKMIGNAVPPKVAYSLALELLR